MTSKQLLDRLDAATAIYDAAFLVWDKARTDYRERRIGDAAFIAAKRRFDVIAAAWDAAYAACQDAGDAIVAREG